MLDTKGIKLSEVDRKYPRIFQKLGYDVLLDTDSMYKPKVISTFEMCINTILTLLFMKPGQYPSLPEIGIDIESYLMEYADDPSIPQTIKDKLAEQCNRLSISGITVDCYFDKTSDGIDALVVEVTGDAQTTYGADTNKALIGISYNKLNDFQEHRTKAHAKIMWENVEKAAKVIDVKLFEYIYMPHLSSNPDRPVRSRQPVLVGYINIKRPQQLVTKKTGLILDDTDTDVMTGEAKGDSKGGTMTGMENELLAGVGANTVLSEIIGARGDNVTEYQAMTAEIAEKGSVSLSDIKTGVFDKPTLLQADLFLSAMGIKTDLISESYYAINKIRNAMNNEK